MSVAPQMSVQPKAQNTAKPYSYTNPMNQMASTLNPTGAFKSFAVTKPAQSVFQSKATTPVTQKPKVVQGSGYGSNYASNAFNYKPPVVTPPPTPTTTTTENPHDAYIEGMNALATQRADFTNKSKERRETSAKSKYQTLKEMISGQLPVAEQNFNEYKSDSQADIDALRAAGERQKGQSEDYYGEVQRDAAKTLAETQGRDQRMFSNLGTIDSRGEGSFQQATENSTSDFNRFTQQTLRAKADKFAEIDDTVATAERQANAAIREEGKKLEDLKRQIQFALINNDQALADELSGIADETEQSILNIQQVVAGIKYQGDLDKYKAGLTAKEDLSAQFIQTGQPQTQADYTWKLQNAKEYGEAFPNLVTNSESTQKMNDVIDTSNLIDTVLASDTNPLTGVMRFQGGWNPDAKLKAQETSSLVNQVSNQLQLAAAGKIKGQGQITENERAILRDAVLALNADGKGGYALSDDELRRRLKEAQSILLRNAGLQNSSQQVSNDALVAQFGG